MVPLTITNGTIGKISNVQGSLVTNGTIDDYQWYHWEIPNSHSADTIGLTNGTIGTTDGTIGTNVYTNGNIGTNGTIGCQETFRVLWLPMVPLATNGTIGKISNDAIGRIPNARIVL